MNQGILHSYIKIVYYIVVGLQPTKTGAELDSSTVSIKYLEQIFYEYYPLNFTGPRSACHSAKSLFVNEHNSLGSPGKLNYNMLYLHRKHSPQNRAHIRTFTCNCNSKSIFAFIVIQISLNTFER